MNVAELVIAEGKTKYITPDPNNSHLVFIHSKDDITAGDGEKHDFITGKGKFSTITTVNCFKLLQRNNIPTHFWDYNPSRWGIDVFRVRHCKMIPVEVVTRRIARGSYCKRNPRTKEGTRFSELEVEFFYKDDKKHDPYMALCEEIPVLKIFPADRPVENSLYRFMSMEEVFSDERFSFGLKTFRDMKSMAVKVFLILEKVWCRQGYFLQDMKIEFGFDMETGQLVVADVIDNDSWRLRRGEEEKSKQLYRDGVTLGLSEAYEEIACATNVFSL